MKIVIDINKRLYTDIRDSWSITLGSKNTIDKIIKAIKNGIPLPEHHGKIVDIGKIDEDRTDDYNPIIYLTINGEYTEAISLDYLNSLPTIIEGSDEE